MLQQHIYHFVVDLVPSWRKTRQKVLALGAQGLIQHRRLTLCAIARGMESHTRIIHRVKRLWRFIDNPAAKPEEIVTALVQRLFSSRHDRWVPVIFDESGLEDRATLLGVGTTFHGRALPLALYAFRPEAIKKSLWVLREGLLSMLLAALPTADRRRLLLIADRGYAASRFFRRLLAARVAFVIRVPRKVLLYMAHQTHRLELLAADLNPGDCLFLTDVQYGPAKATINLLLWWEADQKEPWLLATTLSTAEEARRYYKQRMRIEQLFKDLKTTFGLERCRCQTLDRISRMALFALVALWVLAHRVHYPQAWVRYITARGALSFISLALEWLDAPPSIRRLVRQEVQSG